MPAEKVLSELNHTCRIDPERIVLVAVSGGPDSLALLHMLHQAGIRMHAAHLDHMLRPSSYEEASSVNAICEAWGVPFEIEHFNVGKFATDKKLSIEEAARECRYRFLFEKADELEAQGVITGHTADDQVETVLMHLLRGAGMSGLEGMSVVENNRHWEKDIPLWRPMLGVWRKEVIGYCEEHGLKPVQDESNADTKFFRNRLRLEVIPQLESINPQVKHTFIKMADIVGEDNRLLDQITDEIWQACSLGNSTGCTVIDRDLFLEQPLSIQRRMLRKAIQQSRTGLRDIGYDTIGRGISAIEERKTRITRIDLADNLIMILEKDKILILEKGQPVPVFDLPQLSGSKAYLLSPGESISLLNDWEISARVVSADEMKHIDHHMIEDPLHAWISADSVQFPLMVRGRKPGDSWHPMGLKGHTQKISDLYTNEKVPPAARGRWPLVVSGEDIVWVAGFRPAQANILTGEPQDVVDLCLKKLAR
jgi:tRNA(Ile)-lysidine synthase